MGQRRPSHYCQLIISPPEGEGSISLAGEPTQTSESALGGLPSPKLVSSPEVPFVGGILDVVADVVEHPMSCGTVAGIEHLEEGHHGIGGLPSLLSSPRAAFPIGGEPRATSAAAPSNQENPRKCRHGVSDVAKGW